VIQKGGRDWKPLRPWASLKSGSKRGNVASMGERKKGDGKTDHHYCSAYSQKHLCYITISTTQHRHPARSGLPWARLRHLEISPGLPLLGAFGNCSHLDGIKQAIWDQIQTDGRIEGVEDEQEGTECGEDES
jgi:hypothetical protein